MGAVDLRAVLLWFEAKGTTGQNKSLQKIRIQLNLPAMTKSDISRAKTVRRHSDASLRDGQARGKIVSGFAARNPLKSHDSDERIQANPR